MITSVRLVIYNLVFISLHGSQKITTFGHQKNIVYMSYLIEFIKNRSVGAVSSSSKSLGRFMFGKLNYSDAKVIVELGGGRGVFTHEILKLMSSEVSSWFLKSMKCFATN